MAIAPVVRDAFISVEEYLHTVYKPDNYVAGVLEDGTIASSGFATMRRLPSHGNPSCMDLRFRKPRPPTA